MPLSICQSGQKEIQNVFPVIGWVQYWPRTRILVLLCRRCLLGLNDICSTHYTQQQKCWNTVMKRGTFSEKIWTLPPPHPTHQIWLFFVVSYWPFSVGGGGCHSVPYKTGGRSPKIFLVLRVSVWSKNKRGRAPSLDPPLIFKCERCCLQHLNIVFKGVGEGRLVSPWWSLETCTVGKIQPILWRTKCLN